MSKIEIRPKKPKYKLVSKKSNAGLGLYTLEAIPKGEKIIQYGGYKITDEQADQKGGKYLFDILDTAYTIDGTPRWNVARYINHSCKPNCEAVWYGQEVWICAKRKIQAKEELSYNYGKDYFQDILGGVKGCKCGNHE